MTVLNLDTFEVITAITTTYQNDIESLLIEEDGEVLQVEFADIVMSLYNAYMDDETQHSMLDLIQSKHINIDDII